MKSKRGLLLIITGAVSFILFPYITDFFAVELREASATIAETLLKIAGMAIERNNTILKLGNMTFDIIPACNGSITLTVLFISGLFLVLGNNKLVLSRKIICLLLTVPIALLANGIRLALLVYVSYARGVMVTEGALHNTIGIFGFILALTALLAIIDALSNSKDKIKDNAKTQRELFIVAIVFACFTLLPFFAACVRDWIGTEYNRNDMLGFLFFIPGFIIYIYFIISAPEKRTSSSIRIGTVIFSLSLLSASAFQLLSQSNYILGTAFMVIMFATALMEKGYKLAITIIPALLIMFLGFSKVSESINQVLRSEGFLIPFAIKIVVMFSLMGLLFFLYRQRYTDMKESPVDNNEKEKYFIGYYSTIAITALISVFFAIRGYTIVEFGKSYNYQLNYLMGGWKGRDLQDEKAEYYYSKRKLISRIYAKNNQIIGLMIVPSNAKSRNIHTPEYCQQALNWIIDKSEQITFLNGDKRNISARKLLMHNANGINRTFIYWFDDGEFSTGTYMKFIAKNSFQRLIGEKKNWILYIVWSDTPKETQGLYDFLSHMQKVNITDGQEL